ncbi:RDD domain-containing protein [Tepidicaulis marinus]|uniref:RDD domain-containing protein n=1 Tax=Tepidicaulis marinus TaxID=1333998 RepID=A0A081B7X1_9HYPH|nr:RDD family protein [Tepidicaulis marinus]GAK44139.1 RDD domain-containing protein [Tepidicaulis marinus]
MSASGDETYPSPHSASRANDGQNDGLADPFDDSEFRGILVSRFLAVIADFLILTVLIVSAWLLLGVLGFLTFGLAWLALQLVTPVVFFGYFTLTLGGEHSATPGMRFQGIHAETWDRRAPGLVQAFVQTVLFYLTVSILTPLILLVALFNRRRRCLHDYLSGMVYVRNRELI